MLQSSSKLTNMLTALNAQRWLMRTLWSAPKKMCILDTLKWNTPTLLRNQRTYEGSLRTFASDNITSIEGDIRETCNLEDEDDFRPCETLIHTKTANLVRGDEATDLGAEEMLMEWYAGGDNAANAEDLLHMKEGMKNLSESNNIQYAATEDWDTAVASNAEDFPQCNLDDLMAQEAIAQDDDVFDAVKPDVTKNVVKNQDAGKLPGAV